MKIVNDKLPSDAREITDAETELRILIKSAFIKGAQKAATDQKAREIIKRSIDRLKLPVLKDAARRSLSQFYINQYKTLSTIPRSVFLITVALNTARSAATDMPRDTAVKVLKQHDIRIVGDTVYAPELRQYGVPLKEYAETYEKKVKPVFDRLEAEAARDPDDTTGRNTLRNRAEMEVRYADHLRTIDDFKAAGVKLVVASTHSDCSKRCAPWQGRVYSLDGTSGTAPDGRQYVPLEKATDVIYTTKAGKTYKNGLLGFNCRHYLVEYKDDLRFTKQSEETEQKEYKITLKQREYERTIRDLKVKAIESKGTNKDEYTRAVKAYKAKTSEYIDYCHGNNRAYYPSRIKIT